MLVLSSPHQLWRERETEALKALLKLDQLLLFFFKFFSFFFGEHRPFFNFDGTA